MTTDSDWRLLPEFFLERVFRSLSWRERFQCSQVCQSWAAAFYSPTLWRDICLLPDNNNQSGMIEDDEDMFIGRRGSVPLLQSRVDYDRLAYRTGLCLRAVGHYVHRLCIPATENYYLLHRCLTALSLYLEYVLHQGVMLQLDTFTFAFHSEWDPEHTYGTGGPLLLTLQTVVQHLVHSTAYSLQHIRISRLLLSLKDAKMFMQNAFLRTLEHASQQRRDSILCSSDCELIGYYSTGHSERRSISPASSTSSSIQDETMNAYTLSGLSEHGPPCIGFSDRNNCGPQLFLGLANLTQCVYRPDPLFQMPAIWADRLHTLELSPQNVSAYFLQQLLINTACQVLLVSQDEYTISTVEPWTDIDPLVWHSLLMLRPQFRIHLRLHLVNVHREDVVVQFLDMYFPNAVSPVHRICYENSPFPLDISRALSFSAYSLYLTTLVFHTLPAHQTEGFCDDALQTLMNSCPQLCEVHLSTPVCPDTLWALVHIWRQPQVVARDSRLSATWSTPLKPLHQLPTVPLDKALHVLVVSRSCVRVGTMHWTIRELTLASSEDEALLQSQMQEACVSLSALELDMQNTFNDPSWHLRSEDEFRCVSF